jgi:hypothetical protein
MYYDFIAEFFEKTTDCKPIYRTHLNLVQDGEGLIRENGFAKVEESEYDDYVLETDIHTLHKFIIGDANPEMLAICFEGNICERVRICAYEYHSGEGSFIGFCYGDNDEYRVVFEGNRPDDKVVIETCGGPIIIPLRILKDYYKLMTQFEVAERLEQRIKDVLKYRIKDNPNN